MKKTYSKTSKKLNEVFDFIVAFNEENGYAPSLREIGNRLNISTPSSVKYYVDMLEEAGLILRGKTPRRVITLPAPTTVSEGVPHDSGSNIEVKSFNCPVLGSVAAGVPILAIENIMDYYPLPISDYNPASTFMLEVFGDSMVNAGIDNKDILIIDKNKIPADSNIVVAMIDDSATVKRFYRKDNLIILHPENSKYSDIIVGAEDNFLILGVVVGLIKKF